MRLLPLAAALVLSTLVAALPAGAAALAPVPGEVIVQFKPGAALTRQVALSARATPTAVRDVLGERAAVMGARLGRVLQAGAAVGERTQVMRAAGLTAAELAARLAGDPMSSLPCPTAARAAPMHPTTRSTVR